MKKIVALRQALRDPDLLAHALPGESWASWRILLIALVGEELTADERVIFKGLTGREYEPGQTVDTILVVAGRRSGKSRAMAVLCVYIACLCDWLDVLSLGERGLALFLAPSERQAANVFRYAAAVLDASPALAELVIARTQETLSLSCQTDLEVQPANWRRSRGGTAIAIVLDECAFFHSGDDSANSDSEILTALKPSLATTGGPMLLTSSPSTMEGIVYKLHKRHFGPQGDPLTLVVQADTRLLNPRISQAVIDRAYEDDATAADSEYGGVFRQPSTAFLERVVVEKAVDKVETRLPTQGVQYLAFCDPSGGTGRDSFTVAIGHKYLDQGREIAVLDALFEHRPAFDPDVIVKQVCDTLHQWNISEIVSDAYGAGWVISAFAKHGVTLTHASLSKSEIYVNVVPQFMSGRVRLLSNQRLVDQLSALKRKVGQGGREIVDHPRNQHDDVANAACGLLWRLSPSGPAEPHILTYYQRLSEAATEQPIPTLQQEHAGAALMQVGNNKRPTDFVRVIVPADCVSTQIMTITGASYRVELEGDQRILYCNETDAMALIDSPLALTWFEGNAVLRAELKLRERQRGRRPPLGHDLRWSDVVQAAEDARPRHWNDKGGHAHDALRALGRWQ